MIGGFDPRRKELVDRNHVVGGVTHVCFVELQVPSRQASMDIGGDDRDRAPDDDDCHHTDMDASFHSHAFLTLTTEWVDRRHLLTIDPRCQSDTWANPAPRLAGPSFRQRQQVLSDDLRGRQ